MIIEKKNKAISTARRVIILLAKNYPKESRVLISKVISVMKALVTKVNTDLLKVDEEIYEIYNEITKKINSTIQP